jgi:hypothetical protein
MDGYINIYLFLTSLFGLLYKMEKSAADELSAQQLSSLQVFDI